MSETLVQRNEIDSSVWDTAFNAALDAVHPVCWDIISSQWVADQDSDDFDALYERINDDADFNQRMEEALDDALDPAIDRELEKAGYEVCNGGYRFRGVSGEIAVCE